VIPHLIAERAVEDARCLGCGRAMKWVPGNTPGTPRCSTECAKLGPAVAWYNALLRVAPNRRDATIADLALYAQRAPALHRQARTAILNDFAAFKTATCACPSCGSEGPHHSNEHHRFYRLAYTCSFCGHAFKAVP